MSKAQRKLVQAEIEAMLWSLCTGGVYKLAIPCGEKGTSASASSDKFEESKFLLAYKHFKMESLSSLQFLLKKRDYMAKLDLNDAYFCLPLHKEPRKFVRFQWDGKLYEFFCLCFGVGPAPRIFTKLLKMALAVLRRLNKLIIIYIDDMLIIGRTRKEVELTRDTLIYLL